MTPEKMKQGAFTGFSVGERKIFTVDKGTIEFKEGVSESDLKDGIIYMVMVIDKLTAPGKGLQMPKAEELKCLL